MSADISTLAGNTVVKFPAQDNVSEQAWVSSVLLAWSWDNVTLGTGGPLWVGVAHSDYTAAEIEQWIENTTGWAMGDKVSQEVARRSIRAVGILREPLTPQESYSLNEGMPIRTKCGFRLQGGQTVAVWAYNMGTGAFSTTTPNLHVNGHANIWPQR